MRQVEYCRRSKSCFSSLGCLDLTNNTDVTAKPFVYHGRYHRRVRRQNQDPFPTPDTASAVLSILPLDGIGRILGQLMATGLKEMMNPDVGKKIVNVLENQAPTLLTSLFTNLYSTLGGTVRAPPSKNVSVSSVSMPNNPVKQLSNSSTRSEILDALRKPTKK